jgi:hypothetical protein
MSGIVSIKACVFYGSKAACESGEIGSTQIAAQLIVLYGLERLQNSGLERRQIVLDRLPDWRLDGSLKGKD